MSRIFMTPSILGLACLDVGWAQLAAIEHQNHLAPVADEVLGPLRADAGGDQGSQLTLEPGQLAAREIAVPRVAVARLDFHEPDTCERCGGLGEVGHVVGNALEAEEL